MKTKISDSSDDARAEPSTQPELGQETERTVSAPRLCVGCGANLTGRRRQARYCSDRCRAGHRRRGQTARVAGLLDVVEQTIESLRATIGARHE
jgi:hypothetical protein